MSASILIVDDEALIRQSLRGALVRQGYQVSTADSGAQALQLFDAERPDAVILDLVLGDMNGLDVLRRMKADGADAKVLVVTAHGGVGDAVSAMKLGAYDFVKKPFELEEISAAVRNALYAQRLEHRVEYLAARARAEATSGEMVRASPALNRVLDEALLVARNDVPVTLLVGESGTGKQLLARFLHDNSAVAAGPFVELNCSAIPDSLVESELFGHERGAFSDARERKLGLVEIADGGTLFLDEIGDLGPPAQAKLLTFLEQQTFRRLGSTAVRRVTARVVAATNRDLGAMVADKAFRQDLWYRVAGMTLRLPPLRDRIEDIDALTAHFLAEANRTYRRRWTGASSDALGILRGYRWPGNVRELRAVIHRAALMNDEEVLRPGHLPPDVVAAVLADPRDQAPNPAGDVGPIPTLADVEARHIRRVLAVCNGNRTLAARHLGITRQTLAKKLEEDGA